MYEQTGGLAMLGSPPRKSLSLPMSPAQKSPSPLARTDSQDKNLMFDMEGSTPVSNGALREPFVIGVSGGTASGKTTVCDQIMHKLHDQRVSMLSMDSFYKGLCEEDKANVKEYNFDHPDAFDVDEICQVLKVLKEGKSAEIPTYCFKSHQRLPETSIVNSADVIIIEGILLFQFSNIVEQLNMKIFVDTDDDVRLARRIQRDTVERGRDVAGVINQYTKFVKPMFEQFVLPSKKISDIIIPWARGDNLVAIDLIVQHILTKLGQHDLRRIYTNLDVLPANYQTRGMHTIIRAATTVQSDFVFYADRLIRLVVEHGLGQLPFTETYAETPVKAKYVGVKFCQGLCGVSMIRSGEAMENALRDCCKGVKIGKILIHRPNKSSFDKHKGGGSRGTTPFHERCMRTNSVSPTSEDMLENGMDSLELSNMCDAAVNAERMIIYEKLPSDIANRYVLLLDPILATGNSAVEAIKILLEKGVKQNKIIFCTLIAAPEGITKICELFPELRVITSEIDQGLDKFFRVVPGVGEFGDRYFGTD